MTFSDLSVKKPFILASGFSLISVLLCSILTYASSFALARVPSWTDAYLSSLLAFGSGALLADTFFHIVPHVMISAKSAAPSDNDHDHHHHHQFFDVACAAIGFCFLLGIFFAYFIEVISLAIRLNVAHFEHKKRETEDPSEMLQTVDGLTRRCCEGNSEKKVHRKVSESSFSKLLRNPQALTNLICDLMHNFIDGMSLSISAATSLKLGISSTLAVFCHEVAQEVADFSILRHSGLTFDEALFWNGIVSFSALGGWLAVWFVLPTTFVTSFLTKSSARRFFGITMSDALICFSGGNFLFIALGEMLPSSLESKRILPGRSLSNTILDILKIFFCFFSGVFLLFLALILE